MAAAAVAVLAAACTATGSISTTRASADVSSSASSPEASDVPSHDATPSGQDSASAPTFPAETQPSSAAAAGDYSAGRSNVVADDVYPQYGDVATDVLHYGLDLKWDPSAHVLTGTATLAVRAAKATDRFVLDLASFMTADSVTVDGTAVTADHSTDHLTVPLGRQVAADAQVTVVIAYHGTPQMVPAPVTRPDIQGLGAQVTATGAVWSQQEPYGAFTWYPCNDQPSDKALYDVTITAPDGWAGVTGGAFLGRAEANGMGVYKWHQPDPVATYLVAFAVDQYREDTAVGPHGIQLTYWYLPADADAVHKLTAQVPEMLSFLEQRWGPYPFPTAGVLFRPEMVGMETQTMITLSTHIPADDLLHEFAHHWFGDAVTPKTWEGMWLNEGFAMYSQFMWDDTHLPVGAPEMSLDDFMNRVVLPRDAQLRTMDGPPGHYKPDHFASTNVYYCPAMMLNGIRDKLGDKAFFQLLNDWVHLNKGTNQDRASFTAFVNAHSGHDFTAYINAWLDSATTPGIQP